jgi:hypothetical protein
MAMLTVRTEVLRRSGVRLTENCYYVDIEFNAFSLVGSSTVVKIEPVVYMYRCGQAGQSVSRRNLIKNVAMLQKVSLNLCGIYESLDLPESCKQRILLSTVAKMVGTTVLVFLYVPRLSDGWSQWKAYSAAVASISPRVWKAARGILPVRITLSCGVLSFAAMRCVARLRLK